MMFQFWLSAGGVAGLCLPVTTQMRRTETMAPRTSALKVDEVRCFQDVLFQILLFKMEKVFKISLIYRKRYGTQE
jgi:hypothetical protein